MPDPNLQDWLKAILTSAEHRESVWGSYEPHPSQQLDSATAHRILDEYSRRLTGNYPFGHPRYAGQMLRPPHPIAVAAYVGAMLVNPNNHALDGGPPTAEMEKEAIAQLAAMLGYTGPHLGHLTTSGTIANLEALWVARSLHPGKKIAYSAAAHYTHARMSQVLGVSGVEIGTDRWGRMDVNALEAALKHGDIGCVVVTVGTTGLGLVEPVADVLQLRERYGFQLHADAAYGGFYRLLADDAGAPFGADTRRHLKAIGSADSITIDPHKHGLQPYGCGCVLFRDPSVGRFYKHDSPYTYFTSGDLHLGEISLECSRAGAAAGALWTTLKALPLEPDSGFGPSLRACLNASRRWYDLLQEDALLTPIYQPELDIIGFYVADVPDAARVDRFSSLLFDRAMNDPEDPVFLSLLKVDAATLGLSGTGSVRILRSVLMKPEHEPYVEHLHGRVRHFAERVLDEL